MSPRSFAFAFLVVAAAATSSAAISPERAARMAMNQLDAGPGIVWLDHPAYVASWSGSGMRFQAKRGPGWEWRLESIAVGERRRSAAASAPVLDRTRGLVDYDRGAMIERYVVHATNIEQQFVVERPPGQGDLVITGQIRSTGLLEEAGPGWLWRDACGVVSVGNVTVFDSSGKRLPAAMQAAQDRIRISIDAEHLASASYPVTIDPEIGTNDFRISDMGTTGSTTTSAYVPAVAFNRTENEYLVVWMGNETVDGVSMLAELEIYGQRINAATGAEVGTNDFRISDMGPDGTGSYAASGVSVAWNSTNNEYLVVWRGDDDTGTLVNDEFEIFGQRLHALGSELGTNDFRITDMGVDGSTSNGLADVPFVVYNPTNNEYLVVWRGHESAPPFVANEFEIFAQRLNAATGAEVGANDFRISDAGPDGDINRTALDPRAAYNSVNNEYLVVWQADDLADNETEVHGQRLNAATGAEVGTNDFRISDMGPDGDTNYAGYGPSVAHNPGLNQYLVTWLGSENTGGQAPGELESFGQLLDATGAAIGANDFRITSMGGLGDSAYGSGYPFVSYSPVLKEFLVVFPGKDNATDGFEIYGQRVSVLGALFGGPIRISEMGAAGAEPTYQAGDPKLAHHTNGTTLIVFRGVDNNVANLEQEAYGQLYSISPPPEGDHSADRKEDVFWRNAGSGATSMWLMNGTAVAGTSPMSAVPTTFTVVGIGDFQGDGKADVLWRDPAAGSNVIWFMDGPNLAVSAVLPSVASPWTVAAVADFQADGKADILWHNPATGNNSVWLMSGASVAASGALTAVPDTNWTIAGVGDFQGDGRADVLWRHAVSGSNSLWFMNGLTIAASASLTAVPDISWRVAAVGDFQGDGKADIFWRHSASGNNSIWFMDGAVSAATASVLSVPDVNFQIARVGDFQDDGKADILWRSNQSGAVSQWLMNGSTVAVSTALPTVDTQWQVMGGP